MKQITISEEEYLALTGGEKPLTDEEYMMLCNSVKGVISLLRTKYFFSNRKTVLSCDFRICPLMSRTEKGTLTSKTCHACYAANILNVYANTQNKLLGMDPENPELEAFDTDCQTIKRLLPEFKKLRFYSLSDFGPEDMPFIKIAAKYFTIDIISKTLTMPHNEESLLELFNMENVWVSLSFNRDFMKTFPRIKDLLEEHEPNNVNLNYTMNYREENPDDESFQHFAVLHFKNTDKREATNRFDTVTEERTCAVFTAGGKRVNAHGSCFGCNNCHISHKDFTQGKKPELPTQLQGGC